MDWFAVLETGISAMLVIMALAAVFSKKLISGVIFLSVLSMTAVAAFALLRAPDVAVTEAVIGSGLVTFIFVASVKGLWKAGEEL
ncbi:MAG: hydrogenase subunit MbhD domain-containing protein [Clostridia bacterium]